jgi:hypothetical protein
MLAARAKITDSSITLPIPLHSMKTPALFLVAFPVLVHAAPVALFDGKTFEGWEGDTAKTWRIVDGAFAGGSLEATVPRNEFLATKKSFTNFELRLKCKLVGSEGFVNGGIQFRSKRITNPPNEMRGYQADVGAGYWGCLYDESRRNKMLATADKDVVEKGLKKDDWNDYTIRCEGPRIQLWLNGVKTIDYTETESGIEQSGQIAVQIHGGAKAVASYKDIVIEELPAN